MNTQTLVRVSLKRTPGNPPLFKVAVITPEGRQWRTYPNLTPDHAAARAIKSCGFAAAWCWGWLGVDALKDTHTEVEHA